jgi:CheY-like chemotaxis protein
MDGMTLAMHLKAEPATRDIRIVAWSTSVDNRAAESAAAAGCDGYILKSLDALNLTADVAPFLFDGVPARGFASSARSGLRILVVDDNALGRQVLAAVLGTEGHAVREALDGEQAMSILQEEHFDAVITALMMPIMDGYQLCHKIRGNARLSGLPLIIYSGTLISPERKALAAEFGAIRFLRKPAPINTILGTLRELLSETESGRAETPCAEAVAPASTERERFLIAQLETQGRSFHEVTDQLLQAHHELLVLGRQLEDNEEILRDINARFEEDLRMASETQLAMLHRSYPNLPSGAVPGKHAFRFHQRFAPRGVVSGDFFDVPALSDTKVGVFICDVMGHGVCAALVAAVIRGVLGKLATAVSDPGEVLAEINLTLVPILWKTGALTFASAFYMTADVASGEIHFANAGHPSPILVRQDTGTIERIGPDDHGPVLGSRNRATRRAGNWWSPATWWCCSPMESTRSRERARSHSARSDCWTPCAAGSAFRRHSSSGNCSAKCNAIHSLAASRTMSASSAWRSITCAAVPGLSLMSRTKNRVPGRQANLS